MACREMSFLPQKEFFVASTAGSHVLDYEESRFPEQTRGLFVLRLQIKSGKEVVQLGKWITWNL